ncbi:MAG: UV DNA damage repair endonuclease UvsE [Actinomycetota bacterium]|nr:UV DNA damage repair endonuclease UvsE [Actinomycetota bacterium]
MTPCRYRLGFAVKVLGAGGRKSADTRRWQNEPHLSRSLQLLEGVFDYLEENGIRMYRLSSATVPYGTHPELPAFDFRRQISACAKEVAALGARAGRAGLRLSTHPGQYTVLSAPDPELVRRSSLDLEQDALLLDTMGMGPEAVVVVHVGGAYGDASAALERWARAYEALSARTRRRLVVENDERSFAIDDLVALHRRTGVPVVFDVHHHRLNARLDGLADPVDALAAAYATWPAGVRPKAHLSSPRTELRVVRRRGAGGRKAEEVLAPPLLEQHADFVPPWDLSALVRSAPGPLDVMLEAKAKDLALLALRGHVARLDPEVARAEERADIPADEIPLAAPAGL